MIDRQLADFLEEGLALHIGTRDAQLRPGGGRAVALQVDADGKHLTVHVPEVAIARLLPDLESNGLAAVSIGRPVDERACQVKGSVVSIRPSTLEEKRIIDAQFEHYMQQLETIGLSRAFSANWAVWPAVAVRLKVTAIFEQTPRPGTGQPLA